MALSSNTLADLIDTLTSKDAGTELANAIQNGFLLSDFTMKRLVIAMGDIGVANDIQGAILGTQPLSARDILVMTDAFSSAVTAADTASNVLGGVALNAVNLIAGIVPRTMPPVIFTTPAANVSLPVGSSVVNTTVGPAQQPVTQVTLSAGSTFPSTGAGAYFTVSNIGNANQYYIWYNVAGGSNTDPAPPGLTGIEVTIAAGATASAIAIATLAAINGVLVAMSESVSGAVVTIAPAIAPAAVAVPSFSPVAGEYAGTQLVTLSSVTPGVTFYYTVDGSTPTISSSLYAAPISVGASETIKALGVKTGFANSVIASAAYVIDVAPGTATQVVFTTPPSTAQAGVAFATQPVVTIQDVNGATITTGPDATALITLALFSGTGVLAGTVTKNAVAGVADFSGHGLNISLFGNKVLSATKSATGATGSIVGFSASFNISNSLAAVNLHTAANYAILSESGITNTSGTLVVGNMGVSPIAHTAITGFALVLDGGGTFSTSSQVTGEVFAADYASPTPSNLTTAIGDMNTAYTDAAGRPTPDFTNLGSGELGGLTLTPGLYKFTTGVTISTNTTISGGPNDVWIFQVAGTLGLATAKSIILAGGAKAQNIFWQVAGAVTISPNAVFQGIILAATNIALQTGAAANGRLLAGTAVTLDANAVTQKP